MDLCGTPQKIYDLNLDFDLSRKYPDPLPTIEFDIEKSVSGAYSDVLDMAGSRGEVVSQKIVDILSDMKIPNLQYISLTLNDKRDGSTRVDYKILNILNSHKCFDITASNLKYHTGTTRVQFIRKLVLDQTILMDLKEQNILLFRPAEYFGLVFVYESLKERMEQEKCTGVQFVHPDNFHL